MSQKIVRDSRRNRVFYEFFRLVIFHQDKIRVRNRVVEVPLELENGVERVLDFEFRHVLSQIGSTDAISAS